MDAVIKKQMLTGPRLPNLHLVCTVEKNDVSATTQPKLPLQTIDGDPHPLQNLTQFVRNHNCTVTPPLTKNNTETENESAIYHLNKETVITQVNSPVTRGTTRGVSKNAPKHANKPTFRWAARADAKLNPQDYIMPDIEMHVKPVRKQASGLTTKTAANPQATPATTTEVIPDITITIKPVIKTDNKAITPVEKQLSNFFINSVDRSKMDKSPNSQDIEQKTTIERKIEEETQPLKDKLPDSALEKMAIPINGQKKPLIPQGRKNQPIIQPPPPIIKNAIIDEGSITQKRKRTPAIKRSIKCPKKKSKKDESPITQKRKEPPVIESSLVKNPFKKTKIDDSYIPQGPQHREKNSRPQRTTNSEAQPGIISYVINQRKINKKK